MLVFQHNFCKMEVLEESNEQQQHYTVAKTLIEEHNVIT